MKTKLLFAAALACAFSALADDASAHKKAPVTEVKTSDTASVEQSLTKMEQDWSQVGTIKANIDKDTKTLDQIMADDWVGLDYQGTTNTKAQAIANLKSAECVNEVRQPLITI